MNVQKATTGSSTSPRIGPGSAFLFLGFVLAWLAGAHMKGVLLGRWDRSWSEHVYSRPGEEAKLLGRRSAMESLAGLVDRLPPDRGRDVAVETLAAWREQGRASLTTLPISSFLIAGVAAQLGVGLSLLFWTRSLSSDAAQSLVGMLAGSLIWASAGEWGLDAAARRLGLASWLTITGGRVAGVHGHFALLKASWPLLLMVLVYLQFLEANRCPLFVWFRRRLPIMRGAVATGRIENYGPRTAFQYVMIVWTCYVAVLWSMDESLGGRRGPLAWGVLAGVLVGAAYLLPRLLRKRGTGDALRYAIGTGLLAWNAIEIAGAQGLLHEPWLDPKPLNVAIFLGAPALLIAATVRVIRRGADGGDRAPALPTAVGRELEADGSLQG